MPCEDSSAGDHVGKGDMSDIKSCPKIAGYIVGQGEIRGNISSFTEHHQKQEPKEQDDGGRSRKGNGVSS